ncbi:ABC transporter substrate-binding protein [Frigoribacterium faeni]|uniref:Peptide ABC transporter substrate-binding protein n=1 Tax=Frigoribacterium faeni TaxID=145483 RepID=A0A7W3JH13_9MICO|nr:ABC transporter substrate-binding protein [Frigoribacterium faeni]MBA8812721.1 peptide/nickel transport system substrate-binding protein [Frigoribacterium faeni]BFF13832.1 ABC transporter substrate-binding protein [Microbacterium flavescens]GEK82265.1 peptide ABC transporter substrate-binding protein [Frigoribacterium faeni]
MTSDSKLGRRALAVVGGAAATTLILAGCASGGDAENALDGISIGTTDVITSLDPAGSYDNGSFAVQNQVFGFLMNSPYGSPDVEPDLAESAEFTDPTTYTVTLKPDLTFANGNALTSSDVKFTFDRQLQIADPNGPSSLLANLAGVEAPDDTTVVFTLNGADQTWPQILSSPAAPIVDEDVFSATELTSADDIVSGDAFSGQYSITDYSENETIAYAANDAYDGVLGAAKTDSITATYYTEETDLKLAVQEGDVDVANRSLSPTDLADLATDDSLTVHNGPGGEIRYLVFNLDTMPYGSTQPDADADKALAVRQAIADTIDRDALASDVYNDTYTPLYSVVPDGLTGATKPLESLYGDGDGGPDVDKATETLSAAGVETPVTIDLQYSPDHYGASSDEEYALIQTQLQATGLFEVNLQSTLWDTYSTERREDAYPVYQLGWFPDFSDADNYLSPFFTKDNFVGNHYDSAEVQGLLADEIAESDEAARTEIIGQIQEVVANDLPTLPILQGTQVVVSQSDVQGVDDTLDPSFKFRYAALSR